MMKRRELFGLMACASAGALAAPVGKAATQASALDAAGQLRALQMQAPEGGFAWQRVAEGV